MGPSFKVSKEKKEKEKTRGDKREKKGGE